MSDLQGNALGIEILRAEAAEVRFLREHVAGLRTVLEEAFTALAATLPALSQELDDLASALGAREVEESASMLAAALEALRGVQRLLSDQRGKVILANRDVSELLTVLGRSVEELGTPVAVAFNFAEGIGASVFDAAVSVSAGKSFAPRPRGGPADASWFSLGALSAHSRQTAPVLHETVGALRRAARRLLDARTELGTRAEELGALTGHVGHALDTAAADLTALRDAIQRAHKCIVRSSQLTNAVMVAIQRQDIIRQKLENVLLALMELESVHREVEGRPPGGASLALAMQRQIASMSGRLIDDVQRDLDALLVEVSMSLGSIVETSEALATLRGFAPDLRRLRDRFARPVNALDDVQQTVASLGEIAAEEAEVGRILPEVGENLSAKLSALFDATRGFSNQQHVPRSPGLRNEASSTLSTTGLVHRVHREFETLIELAGHRLNSIKHRGLALTEMAQRIRMDAEGLRRLESAKEKTTALRFAAVSLIDRFERALLVGGALGDEAQRFLKALEWVRNASTQGSRAVAECNTLMRRADAALSAIGPQVPLGSLRDEVQERLQRLVERFTVLSHKAIGRDVNAVGPGRGDAPGTLTMF